MTNSKSWVGDIVGINPDLAIIIDFTHPRHRQRGVSKSRKTTHNEFSHHHSDHQLTISGHLCIARTNGPTLTLEIWRSVIP